MNANMMFTTLMRTMMTSYYHHDDADDAAFCEIDIPASLILEPVKSSWPPKTMAGARVMAPVLGLLGSLCWG